MKQYVIDQLRESDYTQILEFLDKNAEKTVLEGVYQIGLPEDLYTAVQADHTQCQSYYFAVNLTRKQVAFELLIRSSQVLRCVCIGYARPKHRDHILRFADDMLEQLGIRI